MANTIRIKRSSANATPTTLQNAELAFSEVSNGLFIGKGTGGANGSATSIEAIGGKGYFLALADAQTVTGDKEFSGALDVTGTLKLDGTSVTASADEINKLSGVTAGTASAGKVLVVDSNKDLDLDGGDLTVQNLVVDGDLTVQGTVTSINSTTVEIADKAIELAVTATPTDTTADQGGIIVKGATDKSFLFDNSSSSFKSSENLNLASGKVVKINGTEVLSSTALGSGVVSSSLTSVGVLSAGTWEADTIAIAHGGTGETSAQAAINALSQVSGATAGHVLTKVGSDAVWAAPADTGISSLNGLTDDTQTFATGTSGTDFNISSASGVHTFNLPDASTSNRGLVTTGTQTIGGVKTFSSDGTMVVTSSGQARAAQFVSTAAGDQGNIYIGSSSATATVGTHLGVADVTRATMTYSGTNQWVALAGNDGTGAAAVSAIRYSLATASLSRVSLNSASFPSQLFVNNKDAAVPAGIFRGAASQTGNIFVVQNSAQASLFAVDLYGTVFSRTVSITPTSNSTVGLELKQGAGQTAALLSAKNSSNAAIFEISPAGAVTTGQWLGTAIAVANGGTGATTAEGARSNLDAQQAGANLEAIRGLTSAANKVPYFTGSGSAAVADLTSFGRDLIGSANAAAVQALLDLEPGVDVQAQNARLQAIADLSGSFSAGVVNLVGYSATSTAEFVESSEIGRDVLGAVDAAAIRGLLDVEPGVDVMSYDSELAALASLVSSANKLPYFTGSGSAALADFTSFGRSLVASASSADARTELGLNSMALQSSSSVSISGGAISDVSLSGVDLDGGTF